ncbi:MULTISPECIES: hypothetical protein [Methanobrevibacter]|uniref:Uncharacterized protein n=1 Tax=Methanobrevibacter gottschalkii DSM 11977 TaxID=1122229 RepID=A0A3N5BVL8_9EURY|nr:MULTISPECIES: hypothetical protein [Methanobrevibacter]OED01728.1 hypothetical protein A9505_02050 [Methanobrevibacter sp. A27]RPF51422.1 hypothetical protein EDC42_0745 [Methanobrevibacter gottschalkii DSM 11977]
MITINPELTKMQKEFEQNLKKMDLNLSDNQIKEKLALSDLVLMFSFVDFCTSFDPSDVVKFYSD